MRSEIEEIVDRETRARDTGDVDLLLTVFHPDMVWPWPGTVRPHDPERWGRGWQELFDTHELVRNEREIRKIEVSEEGDGAFAVVDVDTVWRDPEGNENRWKGRVCKVYSKVGDAWKMTMHTGVLEYS